MGDNLDILVKYAQDWFKENNVQVPKYAKDWQTSSILRGEIPPGTGTDRLRKLGITQKQFITLINNEKYVKSHVNKPITTTSLKTLGFTYISSQLVNKHKKLQVKCDKCELIDVLDYGTLKRMQDRNDSYCFICRDVGGKKKPLKVYDRFKDFTCVSSSTNEVFYKCKVCNKNIRRAMSYVKKCEYIVCEYCNPYVIGAITNTELGAFDSMFEYLCYKKLLEILDEKDIKRQVSYASLFDTGTKHTADFYIPKLSLVLEVTTASNNIGQKYNDTMSWKLSVSDMVHFAYSLKEVEDIVHSIMKVMG